MSSGENFPPNTVVEDDVSTTIQNTSNGYSVIIFQNISQSTSNITLKKNHSKLRISKHDIKKSIDFISLHLKLIKNQNNLQFCLYKKVTDLKEMLEKLHEYLDKQNKKEASLKSIVSKYESMSITRNKELQIAINQITIGNKDLLEERNRRMKIEKEHECCEKQTAKLLSTLHRPQNESDEQVEELKSQLEKITKNFRNSDTICKQKVNALISCQNDFKEMRKKFQKLGNDYNELKLKVENDQDDGNKMILRLRSELDEVNHKLEVKEKECQEKAEELTATKKDFKKIQEQLARLNGINNECVHANTKLKTATEENLKYLNEISNLKGQLNKISYLYNGKCQEALKLTQHCENLQSRTNDLNKNVEIIGQQLNAAQQQLKCNEYSFKTKNDKISCLENTNSSIIHRVRKLEKDNCILNNQISCLVKDNSIATKNDESAIQDVNKDRRMLLEKGIAQEKQISELKVEVQELSTKYNQAQQNYALAEQERTKNKELFEKSESVLVEEKLKFEDIKNKNLELTEELRELQDSAQMKINSRAEKGVQTCLTAKTASALSSKSNTSTKGE